MSLDDIEDLNGDPLYQRVYDHYASGKGRHNWHHSEVLEEIQLKKSVLVDVFEKQLDCTSQNVPGDRHITGVFLSWEEYDGAYFIGLLSKKYPNPENNNCEGVASNRFGKGWGYCENDAEVRQYMQAQIDLWERIKSYAK
jgi:hypothetical protein